MLAAQFMHLTNIDSLLLGSRDATRGENWPLVQYQLWKQVTDTVGCVLRCKSQMVLWECADTCVQNADMLWFGSDGGSSPVLNWWHFPPLGSMGSVNIPNECWALSLLPLCGYKT